AFSPDGKLLAVLCSAWQSATGSLAWQQAGQECQDSRALAFSSDRVMLATASGQDVVSIWSASNGTLLRTMKASQFGSIGGLAFSPAGNLLAAGTTGGIVLWSVSDGVLLAEFPDSGAASPSVGFSAAGTQLRSEVQAWALR